MGSTAQQYCLRWNNHRSNLLSVFDELLQNESFTDVTISCEGASPIKCHKIVLAACSQYFQNLFSSLACKHPVVVLKDVKYLEIKAILEYMYRGEVNVAQDQLAGLLKVAEALKVKGLVEENRGGDNMQLPIHPRDDELLTQHSPASITTSNPNMPTTLSSSSGCSPPHSTSGMAYNKSPYMYSKSTNSDRNTRINIPMWAVPGFPLSHHPSPTPSQSHQHPAASAAAAMLSCYDNVNSDMSPLKRKKLSSLLMNRDTPILRTVLGQGQVDTSQPVSLVCHTDSHENLHSNESAHDRSEKHLKNEPLEDAQSPYTDLTMMEDEEKSKLAIASSSPQSYTNEIRGVSAGIASYVQSQKPEWKRYKQYTRNDILSAIDAVRNGMSALQAARKYGVPSRTLYDKVKKLGITTSRPFKRGSNGSHACFPYGLSGTSSPYGGGHLSESEEPIMNSHSALLDASSFLQHALDNRGNDERDALAAMAAAAVAHAAVSTHSSPPNQGIPRSPSPNMLKYMRHNSLTPSPAPGSDLHHSETNGSSEREREDDEDQVEDLSINRKHESRVIIAPMNQVSTIIKKDEILKEVLRDECRREVSVDEGD